MFNHVHKKSDNQIEAMKAAGQLSAAVLREVGKLCKPGITTKELDEFAEEYIRARGGVPAFKGYGGFPGTLCVSINDEIVHGFPGKRVLQAGDIVSIDTGAIVDGWYGDNAWTYAVGDISKEKKKLLEVTEKSMWAGIEAARPGNRLGDIGAAVQFVAEQAGYGVVRDYTGHGVGRKLHEDPSVPNYGKRHHGMKLEVGMVLAIEPMLNMGTARTVLHKNGWLVTTADGKPSAHFEKTVAITKDGPLVLTQEPDFKRPVE